MRMLSDNTTMVTYINRQGDIHSPSLCQVVPNLLGKPHIDLFANKENAKLIPFCTRTFHLVSAATDALLFSWDVLEAHAFPLPCLILKIFEGVIIGRH